MFGKMMNRYYYGKSGKGDFEKEDLPQNRWQLFWETLRVRFSSLIRLNLMYVIAWLPALFVIGRFLMYFLSALMVIDPAATEAAADAATLTLDQSAEMVQALLMQTLILLIPAIAITGPFTAGTCYVTRNWARDEHSFVMSDFKDAVKENWKHGLATSAITSITPLLLYICYRFYGDMSVSNPLFIIPQVMSISIVVLWLCSLLFTYPQMVTYQLTFVNLLKNSFFLTIARLPATVGLKLLSIVPSVLCLGIGFITGYLSIAVIVLLLYYVIIGYSLSRFVAASYTNAVFDRYINTRIEGAAVNKGLYVEDDEDDEESALPSGDDE